MARELLPVDDLATLRRRRSAKWRANPADVLPLTIAETDFALAPPVRTALQTALDLSDTGYGFAGGELGDALAGFAHRRWGWEVDPTLVTATTDVSTAVVALLRAATRPGDTVVLDTPSYPPMPSWLEEAGVGQRSVPLTESGGLDLEGLERAFAERPAAYLLCNPQNPTGRVHRPDELRTVVELARKHAVVVISDEIHAPLTLPGASFTPLLTVPGAAEVAIVVHSASKGWNLAGLKCAAIVTGSPETTAVTDRLPADTRWRVGHFGVLATVAAYSAAEDWLDQLLLTLDDRRTLMGRLLERELPEVTWTPPEATYLAWVDCSALAAAPRVAEVVLADARVAVEPGSRFGPDSANHVRINLATSRDVLESAVVGLARAARDG